MVHENNDLTTINSWDDVADDTDLFDQLNSAEPADDNQSQNESSEESDAVDNIQQNDIDKQEPADEEQQQNSEEKKEDDLFDPNADTVTEEDLSRQDESTQSRNVYQYLLDNNFIDSQDDDFDVENATDNDIEDYIQDRLDATVESSVREMLNDLPDFVKDLNKYVLNGGDWQSYIQHYQETSLIPSDLDMDNETNQKNIITQYLQSQGFDDNYIGLQLEFLTENGKLKDTAKKQYDVIQQQIKAQQEQALKEQEEKIAQLKQQEREYKKSLNTYVRQVDNIGDISLTKDDKRNLSNYVSDRKVKLTNGTYITEMQKELYYDIPQNQEAMLQLAVLMRNRNEDGTFNFDNIKKQLETKITRNIKDNMRRNKSGRPDDTKVGKSTVHRTLADYFN